MIPEWWLLLSTAAAPRASRSLTLVEPTVSNSERGWHKNMLYALIWCCHSAHYFGWTNLHSISLVFGNVPHFQDGSIWAFGYEAQDLWAQKYSYLSVSTTLLFDALWFRVPGNGLVQGIDAEGTQAERRRWKPEESSLLPRSQRRPLEAAGLWGRAVCRPVPQAEKTQLSVQVCEWWRPPCLRGTHDWVDAEQLDPLSRQQEIIMLRSGVECN